MTVIIVILVCILMLSGIADFILDTLGFGVKLLLSIILVLASIYLGIKLFIIMIPWMFALSIVAFIVGMIWLIKTLIKH